jgi:two-component system chemotaxis sensor kinase CheA
MDSGELEAEFRQVFVQEACERLDAMSRLLLEIEVADSERESVAALFREAHTLKGGAAMVGFAGVGRLAHTMEDLLTQLRGGTRPLTARLVDALLVCVDALRAILSTAAAGEPHDAEVEAAERALLEAAAEEAAERDPTRAPAVPAPPTAAPAAGPPEVPAAGPAAGPGAGVTSAPALAPQERLAVPVARIDELVRLIGETVAGQLRLGVLLGEALNRDPESLEEFRVFSHVLRELQEVAIRTRMVPLRQVVPGLQRAVRDVARGSGKRVRFVVSGEETEVDRRMLDLLADALLHLVRNAVDHGLEAPEARTRAGKQEEGTVRLTATQRRAEALIVLSDDGRGIDLQRVRDVAGSNGGTRVDVDDTDALQMIFRSGFSTAAEVGEFSGRGVGLDVVRDRLETIQGRLEVQSQPGLGTEFRITVPLTLAVVPSLLVMVGGQRFALPMHSVERIIPSGLGERWAGGRPVVMIDGHSVPLDVLGTVLGIEGTGASESAGPAVLLHGHAGDHGFLVDQVLGQRQVVVKNLSSILPRLPAVVGASAEPDGAILLMLEATALIEKARQRRPAPVEAPAVARQAPGSRVQESVLVVDDSVIVREVERSILERAGYRVLTAGDGVEALSILAERPCDLVVTDIDMPRMDGLQLTAEIRALPRLTQLPVILLTARADEESHRKGLEAGADGYVVKSAFDRTALLGLVHKALGRP